MTTAAGATRVKGDHLQFQSSLFTAPLRQQPPNFPLRSLQGRQSRNKE